MSQIKSPVYMKRENKKLKINVLFNVKCFRMIQSTKLFTPIIALVITFDFCFIVQLANHSHAIIIMQNFLMMFKILFG